MAPNTTICCRFRLLFVRISVGVRRPSEAIAPSGGSGLSRVQPLRANPREPASGCDPVAPSDHGIIPRRLREKLVRIVYDGSHKIVEELACDIARRVDEHEIGKLIMTIKGVGPLTAGSLIAELGDPHTLMGACWNRMRASTN